MHCGVLPRTAPIHRILRSGASGGETSEHVGTICGVVPGTTGGTSNKALLSIANKSGTSPSRPSLYAREVPSIRPTEPSGVSLRPERSGFGVLEQVRIRLTAPPMPAKRTRSPPTDRPAEAQESRRFPRPAVHLRMPAQAWNCSLAATFLRGRSLGPFGTHFAFCRESTTQSITHRSPSLRFLLAGRIRLETNRHYFLTS